MDSNTNQNQFNIQHFTNVYHNLEEFQILGDMEYQVGEGANINPVSETQVPETESQRPEQPSAAAFMEAMRGGGRRGRGRRGARPRDEGIPPNYPPPQPHMIPPPSRSGSGSVGGSSSTNAGSSSTSKRAKTSNVWNFFDEFTKVVEYKGVMQPMKHGRCKKCSREFCCQSATHGTKQLNTHIEKCSFQLEKALQLSRGQATINSDGTLSNWKYDNDRARENLCRFIAVKQLPLNFGEGTEFKTFIQESYYPHFQPVSRNTTRSDMIKYYKKQRLALKNEFLQNDFCLALTSDLWSANAGEDYLSVVAHYCDATWILNKKIIGFKVMKRNHTGENIARSILQVLADFHMRNRVISVTLDNAAANTKAMEYLESTLANYAGPFLLHQRCVTHVINLIVKTGMKQVSNHLDVIRDAISYIRISTNFNKFERFCKNEDLQPRKFNLDMEIRWNSTYLMLKSIIPYRGVVSYFYNSEHESAILQDKHWDLATYYFQFLKVFYNATVELSGVYYTTGPLVLHRIFEIAACIKKFENDNVLGPCVLKMKAKFVKYWYTNLPLLYMIAFILDPRIKILKLQKGLRKLGMLLDLDYEIICEGGVAKFKQLYSLYETKFGVVRDERPRVPSTSNQSWILDDDDEDDETQPPGSQTIEGMTELDRYLNYSIDKEAYTNGSNFDYLRWWQEHQTRFPVLSRLARDVFSIPVSTVSSESAFSKTKRVLEDRRHSLAFEMVEILTLLKDWEEAKERRQHSAINDLIEDFEDLGLPSGYNDD